MRRQNNGYFKLFAKNLFSMLFEIRNSYCDVINNFLFVPTELVLL